MISLVMVSGYQHQGYRACPPCGFGIVNRWSKSSKNLFMKGRVNGCSETIHIELTLMLDILIEGRRCEGGHIQKSLRK